MYKRQSASRVRGCRRDRIDGGFVSSTSGRSGIRIGTDDGCRFRYYCFCIDTGFHGAIRASLDVNAYSPTSADSSDGSSYRGASRIGIGFRCCTSRRAGTDSTDT